MPVLEVRGLVKYYGRRKVVSGVDFEVEAGEIVGLLGPNGAGKTTSFRMTTGQITPHSGKVLFNDHDVTHLPMYRRARLGMGYLSQETSVFRKLSVEQNILAILEAMPSARSLGRRFTRRERWKRTEEVLEQFGLTKVRKSKAARLSGGEKRRLEIARCLVCEPLLILLDEPFTGIDPKTIGDIQEIVLQLRSQGIGILVTDHNVHATLKITDRSYLIKDGEVRTRGTPQQLVRDQIAIDEYLGKDFHTDTFSSRPHSVPLSPSTPTIHVRPQPQPQPELEAPVHKLLEKERIHELIQNLKTELHAEAAEELVRRGPQAVSELLQALERRDVEMRRQAFAVLQGIYGNDVAFDPYAPEVQRRLQIAGLREQLERRAG